MSSSRMLRRVVLVRTKVSEEHIASIFRATTIDELRTTLTVISNRCTLFFLRSVLRLLVTANDVPSSPILVTLKINTFVPPKCRFLREPQGVTSQKNAFFNAERFVLSLFQFLFHIYKILVHLYDFFPSLSR
jgi:hypothetical protein